MCFKTCIGNSLSLQILRLLLYCRDLYVIFARLERKVEYLLIWRYAATFCLRFANQLIKSGQIEVLQANVSAHIFTSPGIRLKLKTVAILFARAVHLCKYKMQICKSEWSIADVLACIRVYARMHVLKLQICARANSCVLRMQTSI